MAIEAWRTVLVLGWGVTGQAVTTFLVKQTKQVIVWAPREQWPKKALPSVTFVHYFPRTQIDGVIISPGIPKHHAIYQQCAQAGLLIWSDLDLFSSQSSQTIYGVTGTNGKSTLVHALGTWMADKLAIGGNLGPPAITLLDQPQDACLLEVSSYQLSHSDVFSPALAVVLNIAPDHLGWHGNLEAYVEAKTAWLSHARHVVCNADDPYLMTWACENTLANITWFSPKRRQVLGGSAQTQAWIDTQCQQTSYPHAANILTAIAAMGEAMDWDLPAHATTPLPCLPHRCQSLGLFAECEWFDDSKATNVTGAFQTIAHLCASQPCVALMGGQLKESLQSMPAWEGPLPKAVICFGESRRVFKTYWQAHCPCIEVVSLADAVKQAMAWSAAGDAIVLAPGGASFDAFQGFSARGTALKKYLEESVHGN